MIDDIPKTAGKDSLDIGISLLDEAIFDDVEFETVVACCGVEVGTKVAVGIAVGVIVGVEVGTSVIVGVTVGVIIEVAVWLLYIML